MPTISLNAYPLGNYMRHYGLQSDLLSKFILVNVCGGDTLEMGAGSPEDVDGIARLYEKFRMESKVCVCGANLFEDGWESSLQQAVNVAGAFRERLGTSMVNMCLDRKTLPGTNEAQVKNEEELDRQARAYRILIQEIEALGMNTCFHMHDTELLEDWKEIHAMVEVNPEMAFCMDAHWIYTGSGNSMEAVTRFLDTFGRQIVHLHVRQSVANQLQDTFTLEGDIDYLGVFRSLAANGYRGNVSLEQMRWDSTPETVTPFAVSAIRGLEEIRTGWAQAGLT